MCRGNNRTTPSSRFVVEPAETMKPAWCQIQTWYLFSQGEGVVRLHGNSQDPLVSIDDRVRDGGKGGVADLQTDTGDVSHTLQGGREMLQYMNG